MPLLDITKPDVIKFLVENYEKTARLRMKWNSLHKEKLKHAATLQREEKGYHVADVLIANLEAGMPATTRDFISGARNRRLKPIRDSIRVPALADLKKCHTLVDIELGDPTDDPRLARPDTDTTIDPIMRPISPSQTNIIYEGLPYAGRNVYINTRNKISPEDKYYFSPTSNSDYGWRLKDSYFGKSKAKYPRVCRLDREGKSRTGPQPDPKHYKSADVFIGICEA